MRELTEEEMKAIDERWDYEDKKLLEWGWYKEKRTLEDPYNKGKTYESEVWIDPNGSIHQEHAYTDAVGLKLREQGWVGVTEIKLIGREGLPCFKKHDPEKWARYQSPTTKKIYPFLEAMDIFERNGDEDPKYCSDHALLLNELIGENFTGDTIQTQFHLDGEDRVLSLWEDKDGKIIHTKSVRIPKKEHPGSIVSWGPFGLEYS